MFTLPVNSKKLRQSSSTQPKSAKALMWHWGSIVLLGVVSNTAINAIFDYKYQRPLLSISLEEYFNAIVASWVLLSGTRWISGLLDNRMPWQRQVFKRLWTQVGLHLLFIIVVLNALLISITYYFYGGFYATGDLFVIDLTVVVLSFFFSSIDTGIVFYKHWNEVRPIAEPSMAVSQEPTIEVNWGKTRQLIRQSEILYAMSEHNAIYLYTEDGKRLLSNKSLDALSEVLDPHLFFRANRQSLVRATAVSSFKSLPQGKVQAVFGVNGHSREVVVSRAKAAAFRSWVRAQTA